MTSSEDKKLGYFFCKACNGKIDAEKFVNKVLFYLWNDVFKDYELSDKAFQDGEGKLNFNKFYTPSGEANEETIIKFLDNLEVEISEYNHEGEDDDELEDNTSPAVTLRKQKCKEFWTDFFEYAKGNQAYMKIFGNRTTPSYSQWISFGVFNNSNCSLSIDQFRSRNELTIAMHTKNKEDYYLLFEHKNEIEQELVGIDLKWKEKPTKKDSAIENIYKVTNFEDPHEREQLFNHSIDVLMRIQSY